MLLLNKVEKHRKYFLQFQDFFVFFFTPDGEIDLSRVIVSRGSVERVEITSASIDDNVITVTFDSRVYGGRATDEFYLFIYCPAFCTGRLATPVLRSAGLVTAVLPSEWHQPTELTQADTNTLTHSHTNAFPLHLYAFLRSTRSRTSDTIHLSLPV